MAKKSPCLGFALLLLGMLTSSSALALPFAYIPNWGAQNCSGDSDISVIDAASGEVSATISVGEKPYDVALRPDGLRAYVTIQGKDDQQKDSLAIINTDPTSPDFNTVLDEVETGVQPYQTVITPDGTRAYVSLRDDEAVQVFDISSDPPTPAGWVDVNRFGQCNGCPFGKNKGCTLCGPKGLVMMPDGNAAFVANYFDDSVMLIDTNPLSPSYHQVKQWLDLSPSGQRRGSRGLALSPDATRLYVVNRDDGSLTVVDTASLTATHWVSIGPKPKPTSTEGPRGIAVSPDGTRLYIARYDTNSVFVIETVNYTKIDEITVGEQPFSVSMAADGLYALVTNSYIDVTASCQQASQNPGTVSVINTRTHEVVDEITVGLGPTGFGPFIGPHCPGLIIQNTLLGTDGNDIIQGTNKNDLILGLWGNDTLIGQNGNDCLVGGPGQDFLQGDNGDDMLLGGEDDDIVLGGLGNDVHPIHAGSARLFEQHQGGAGNDSVWLGGGLDVEACARAGIIMLCNDPHSPATYSLTDFERDLAL